MWKNIGLDKCKSLIQSEFIPKSVNVGKPPGPTVTISRMTGAGGHTVASALAYYLQENTPGHPRWTIFDQNLVEKALEDHPHAEVRDGLHGRAPHFDDHGLRGRMDGLTPQHLDRGSVDERNHIGWLKRAASSSSVGVLRLSQAR